MPFNSAGLCGSTSGRFSFDAIVMPIVPKMLYDKLKKLSFPRSLGANVRQFTDGGFLEARGALIGDHKMEITCNVDYCNSIIEIKRI